MQMTTEELHRKVLIVDDEPVNRQLLGMIVSREYDVLYAENGREALALLNAHRAQLSLVLLDLLMPEMDGYELLAILHEDQELRRIPVIVLTSERSAEVRSLQLGAADFIAKPYDLPDVILARIRRSIELAEDSRIINATELDSLTGLYTRDYFFEYCSRFDDYHPEQSMDCIVLDINRFHLINEIGGRAAGNTLLQTVSTCMTRNLSGSGGLVCRYDKDTFYAYIPHRSDYRACLEGELCCTLQSIPGIKPVLRMGLYENADRSLDITERFDRAASACNTLRGSYQTDIARYDDKLHEQELYDARLISEMDTALEQRQFRVFYQPKYRITGESPVLCSAEALIRWAHPELGMISPGTFIPLFETNGLIHKLDRFVWREAAAQIARWKRDYGVSIPVSVNVSRIDIHDPQLEAEILSVTEENGLAPDELLLEVTESAYTDNSRQIIEKVERLRAKGFRFEMDDFGSGYSSLNMLTEMPIDALKLDMAFIRNICRNPKDARMVELVIEIAEFLNVPVIAEGVEDAGQLSLLKRLGCDIIQGYYFSKPVPPEEFAAFIEETLHSPAKS